MLSCAKCISSNRSKSTYSAEGIKLTTPLQHILIYNSHLFIGDKSMYSCLYTAISNPNFSPLEGIDEMQ